MNLASALACAFVLFGLLAWSCVAVAKRFDDHSPAPANDFSGSEGGAVAARLSEGSDMRYYHGGVGHLTKGQYLLPPAITRARSLSEFGAADVHRRDRVYVTTDPHAALLYAAAAPARSAAIYEVEPDELEHDPDCNVAGLSFQCSRARIVRVVEVLTEEERVTTMQMLQVALEASL